MQVSHLENINCPLCNQDRFKLKYCIDKWSIVKCKNCGFVYTNPRLTKNEILELYSDNYFENSKIGYEHYEENARLRRQNFKKWVDDSLQYIPQKNSLKALDIGCAAGYCLEVFEQKQWMPYGLELNKKYAKLLSEKYYVYAGSLLTEKFSDTYDLITLFDVVEHLTDLIENFKKLHSILADDGKIIIITPNYNSIQRKLLGKKWFQFKPSEHINYFSLQTFNKLVKEAGFDVILHKPAGQFTDLEFIKDRLKTYKLNFLRPVASFLFFLIGRKKTFYADTASLYFILKKSS